MQDQSYYVHLESLKDFVRELETQIHAMSKPNDFLLTLTEQPLLFGEFGEAGSLTKAHQAAVAEMQGLLDQVKGAITFAQDVTTTVADGYAAADDSVAGDINHASQQTGLLDPLLNVLGGVLGGTNGSNGGGDQGMTETAHTNFAAYSHQQLYAMLQTGDPNTARHAAHKWQSTGLGLFEQAENLTGELKEFSGNWTGGAADKYHTMISDLVGGIRKVAQTAQAMNNLLEDAADALVKAKKEMPPPVAVPDVSPADLALAVNPPLLPPDSSPATIVNAAQQRQQAIANVEAQQQAAGAASAAHSKAIVVMTQLAGEYSTAEESIPASPNAVTPPPVTGGGTAPGGSVGNNIGGGTPGVGLVPGDNTHPLPSDGSTPPTTGQPGQVPKSNPLFGDMFTAGLAAASAAAFGRFGSIMPRVPAWASGKNDGKDKNGEPTGGGAGSAGATAGGAGGGIPIGGGGAPSLDGGAIGAGGGGVSGPGEAPAAFSGLAGDGGSGSAMSGLAGGAAGAAGAAAAKGAMPMMPMMPMGMGAGGDMGSGRRIPPWLVETENVWGQSSPVAPAVLGEEPEQY